MTMGHTEGKQSYYIDDDGYIVHNETGDTVACISDTDYIQDLTRILGCYDALLETCEETMLHLEEIKNYLTGNNCSASGLYSAENVIQTAIAAAKGDSQDIDPDHNNARDIRTPERHGRHTNRSNTTQS